MRRIKASFIDIINNDIKYFASQRVKNADGVTGIRFILDAPLTEAQKSALKGYKNIIYSNCYYKYAPQTGHDTIIILDKCIKVTQNG
jgi:hypothetical protein